ncbi:MAG TPA: UDP-N-acetylmuramoyl-L-alanyl-D-glutamate--2,6-diaminopimelate ligase [Polyangia bacterium]|nr:UDP-N-acetylmuramoyl-L-alanyl-D-glutamate--2,6-diaminopimelate ligase [Polyangia bacterium]
MMTLRELLRGVEIVSVDGDLDQLVGYVRDDSRAVEPGDVFIAVPGRTVDGHGFLDSAAQRGARAAVVERALPFSGVRVVVRSSARAVGILAANRFGNPGSKLTLCGVTGTNGKTTTTHLIEWILAAAGARVGMIGTVHYRYPGVERAADLTTPSAIALQQLLRQMLDAGTTHVVMEVSSIALDQARLAGLFFHVAAFTNLTQDHLDYHGSMEAYFEAKALLFSRYLRAGDGVAVAFVDRPPGPRMLEQAARRKITCSTWPHGGDVSVESARLDVGGIEAQLATPRGPLAVRSPLLAQHNLENIVVAVGVAEALGLPHPAVRAGIEALHGVPGRLEPVDLGDDRVALVDYAHTPDALAHAIAAVRPLARRRLIVVFGCGGDRDRSKRPLMGRIAAEGADLAIITSDNPRTEDPQSIVDMIAQGARAAGRGWIEIEVDRRQAIRRAVGLAESGDVVLIAGKGHEDYQILGKTKIHFDDREETRAAAAELRQGKGP